MPIFPMCMYSPLLRAEGNGRKWAPPIDVTKEAGKEEAGWIPGLLGAGVRRIRNLSLGGGEAVQGMTTCELKLQATGTCSMFH